MKREVVGFSTMANSLLKQHLSTSSFFFASQQGTMLAMGTSFMQEQAIPFAKLSEHAQSMLAKAKSSDEDNPVLFAAIPFNEQAPARLFIPESLFVAGSPHSPQHALMHDDIHQQARVISPPSGQHYKFGVQDLVARFQRQELSKAVLARTLTVETAQRLNQYQLLHNLLAMNPQGYTFAVDVGHGEKLMGASPELLVAKKGSHVISNPLAGSRPRSTDPMQNHQSRQSLLDTSKDLHEHALVVEEVERVMSRYCRNLYSPMVPSIIETETMLHLSTVLEGDTDQPDISVLDIAAELHPTPAVCGFPRELAYQSIQALEPVDRGYFSGMVGWCDARGNGEWVVTIRCGKVSDYKLQVFAGAGIVLDSDPQSELEETGAKMNTFLKAAGIHLDKELTA